MIRLRLLLLVAGAGTLLAGLPANATARVAEGEHPLDRSPRADSGSGERQALELLDTAARAAVTRTYRGTQYVSAWRPDRSTSSVADIRHTPAGGSVVELRPTAGDEQAVAATTELDVRMLRLLADNYTLEVVDAGQCAGRTADVVEARDAQGLVAGRFWVDRDSALVLRREVFDHGGQLIRSSAFASLTVDAAAGPDAEDAVPAGGRLTEAELDRLRTDGWRIPANLPGSLSLYDARVRTHDAKNVLHLAYSDGLSSLSLFAQRGRLGSRPMDGFAQRRLGGAAVWMTSSSPQRVVWGGSGQVFTLLSDAPVEAVTAAVKALPHDKAPSTGVLARIGRGLARLASWLNPFG